MRPFEAVRFGMTEPTGWPSVLELTAVTMRAGRGRAALLRVDNAAREIHGEVQLDAAELALDARIAAIASELFRSLETAAGPPSPR